MPSTHVVTVGDASGTATHEISFTGFTGLMFWVFLGSFLLYVLAFSTEGWASLGQFQIGLWRTCICGGSSGIENEAWFSASQAMFTIGLIGLCFTLVVLALFMLIHSLNKNTLVMLIIGGLFGSVLFLLIGLIVFGASTNNQSFSFAFTCISTIAVCAVGVMMVIHRQRAYKAGANAAYLARQPGAGAPAT